MSGFTAFTPERATAIAIIRRIWGELRQWKATFENWGATGQLVDQLSPAFRDLGDICSAALEAEIRMGDDYQAARDQRTQ